jgi:hypothetical protein
MPALVASGLYRTLQLVEQIFSRVQHGCSWRNEDDLDRKVMLEVSQIVLFMQKRCLNEQVFFKSNITSTHSDSYSREGFGKVHLFENVVVYLEVNYPRNRHHQQILNVSH